MVKRLFQPVLVLALLAAAGCGGKAAQQQAGPVTRPAILAPEAQQLATQAGGAIFYIPTNGVFSILDDKSRELLLCSPVAAGQRLLFSPESQQVVLNGVVLMQGGLNPARQYSFYFEKE
jgi:hypothetical protein